MAITLVEAIALVLVWIGLWNIGELIIDEMAGNDKSARFLSYLLFAVIGIVILWYTGYF